MRERTKASVENERLTAQQYGSIINLHLENEQTSTNTTLNGERDEYFTELQEAH